MKIEGKEAELFSHSLAQALQQGYRYVALPFQQQGDYLQSEGLQFFKDKEAVDRYNYTRRSKQGDILESVPILSLKQQLDRRMELERLSHPGAAVLKDIFLDIGLIQFQERARAEIFAEDILRQLKAHLITTDLKGLMKNIAEDKSSFEVPGIRREGGIDQHYLIRIEQNDQRGFAIGSVEKKQDFLHEIKSEGLQVTLVKGELKEIHSMLQRQIESGNRFVAFPSTGVLDKESFVAFKSAFAALQHAHENSTARDRYMVRSLLAVQVEISKLLETKRKNHLQSVSSERTEKIPRGPDRSR